MIGFVSVFVMAICFLISFSTQTKRIKLFIVTIVLASLTEAIYSGYIYFHAYTLIEFLILSYVLMEWEQNKSIKYVLTSVFACLITIEVLTPLNKMDNLAVFVETFSIMLLSGRICIDIILYKKNFIFDYRFAFAFATLFYTSITAYSFIENSFIHQIGNVVSNLIYGYSFVLTKRVRGWSIAF